MSPCRSARARCPWTGTTPNRPPNGPKTWSSEAPDPAALVRAIAARRARPQEVRGLDQGLRAVGDARRAPDALLGAVGEAHVARRRNRTRLPPAARPGGARVARRRRWRSSAPATPARSRGSRSASPTAEAGVSGARRIRRRSRTRRPWCRLAPRCLARCSDAKAVSASTLGRATTAVRGVGRSVKESQDVGRAQDKLDRRAGGAEGARERSERGDCRAHGRGRRQSRPSRPSRSSRSAAAWTSGSWRSPGSRPTDVDCPRCGASMQEQTLDGHAGRPVAIDVCLPCQSFWFDAHESVQLSPGGTLALFRLIGEHAGRRPFSNADVAKCPRCKARLRLTQDMQRATRFSYLSCPNDHGRLTTFFDFLREKDFIRPLTAEQLQELRQNVQTVNCSNCGAPVDVMRGRGLRALPLAALDARSEAGGGAGGAAAAAPTRASASRLTRRCRSPCCGRAGRRKRPFRTTAAWTGRRRISSAPGSRPSPAGSSGTRKG